VTNSYNQTIADGLAKIDKSDLFYFEVFFGSSFLVFACFGFFSLCLPLFPIISSCIGGTCAYLPKYRLKPGMKQADLDDHKIRHFPTDYLGGERHSFVFFLTL
jgi:hypothetical protein